ncbi:MAG: arsenic transporter [Myxococcales bacterium]|nr:arsenic transporter [Myxococcales bacterium]
MTRSIAERPLVLVTGKGGVGKTTVSAALAIAAQEARQKTLVAEITSDPLATSPLLTHWGTQFTQRLDQPVTLGANLDGVQISPSAGHRLFLRAALRVGVLADAAMRSSALNRFLLAAPAFPEIGVLYQLVWLWRLKKYERIIVDLPATGHALGLVKLPRTVTRVVPKGLVKDAITEGLEILTNRDQCGTIIVTLPERLPVTESFELHQGLQEVGVSVGALLLNRMPEDVFSAGEREVLGQYIATHQDELLLGSREFRRLGQATRARAAFYQQAAPLLELKSVELPVFDGEWRSVINAAAQGLVKTGLALGPRGQ